MRSLQVELDKHKEEGGRYQSHEYLQIGRFSIDERDIIDGKVIFTD